MKNLMKVTSNLFTTASLDNLITTIGKYINYKMETELIDVKIKKIEAQTDIIIQDIEANLEYALDRNIKEFQKEMKRLRNIEKELKSNRKAKNQVLNALVNINMKIINMNIPSKDKALALEAIKEMRELLQDIFKSSNKLIDSMSNYNTNQLSNYNSYKCIENLDMELE